MLHISLQANKLTINSSLSKNHLIQRELKLNVSSLLLIVLDSNFKDDTSLSTRKPLNILILNSFLHVIAYMLDI
jgi:hypothetical protein